MDSMDFTTFSFEQFQELEQMNYDKMVEVQFNENILKQNFKLIIKVLQSFSAQFKKMNVIDDINKRLDDYKKRIEALEKENKELKKEQDTMKKEQDNQQKSINDLQTQNNDLRKTDSEQQKQINLLMEAFFKNRQEEQQKEIDDLRELLKQLMAKLGQFKEMKNENISEDKLLQLEKQIMELIKQIEILKNQMDQFLTKKEFQAFSIEFEDLKNNFSSLRDSQLPLKFQEVQTQFNSMNNEIEKIKEEIRRIYAIISQLGSGEKEIIIPTMDTSSLNNLEKRVITLETKQKEHLSQYAKDQSLYNQFKNETGIKLADLSENKLDKKDFKKFMNDIQEQIKQLQQENQLLKSQIRELENQINNILKKLGSMDGRRKSSAKQVIQQGLSQQEVQKMIDDAIQKLRDELMALIKKLQDALENKVDTEEHYNTIQEILKKIDDIVNSILKKCADSNDTKKALIFLDKKIQDLYLLLAGDKQCHDDGLFVKRPLFWSCASCDKDLDKFNGRLGQFKNWAVFPPKETSPERMARFGIGYAKYVDTKKQKLEREKEIAGIYLDSNFPQQRPTTAQPYSNFQDSYQGNDSKTQLPNVHGAKIKNKNENQS